MADGGTTPQLVEDFIAHWSKAQASERANAQPFLIGLAEILGVPGPSNTHADGYTFEFPVKIPTGPGTTTDGRIDLYRRGSFVLEAKQFASGKDEPSDLLLAVDPDAGRRKSGPVRGSDAWDDAMWKARGQAERYARSLPASEPPAPFLLVVDVGHSIEVFADFTQAGRAYHPFPDPRGFRIRLADLRDETIRARLRAIWLDPLSLDPAKVSAAVTREIAGYLAKLAASLEDSGHPPRLVAEFLTRCLFCMFAEDVGLLPKEGFRSLLESLRGSPEGFVPTLRQLFAEMQTGHGFSTLLRKKILRFNGGLFEDASVLPLDATQLAILIQASTMQWKDVEPAIFGTLLERALDPEERHQLGAHFTPRAYVERLVLPTVVEPLRAEWDSVRTAAATHARRGDLKNARAEVNAFHDRLCSVTILDPACGSGNFLYVALQHLKLLEGEVLDAAAGFGENFKLELETHTVDPHQFLGIEKNERAASIAELVLWIGYLQWHFKIHGQRIPPEPILRAFKNIECRDAVLAWDGQPQPVTWEMARGNPNIPGLPDSVRAGDNPQSSIHDPQSPITVWDRRSTKTDPVTGREIPDETRRVPLLAYPNARPAEWITPAHPRVDFIVGNPPFLGTARMREDLGDGYAETLRAAYPEVPESADFVMYWWHKAAQLVRSGATRRFGLITTNSLRQTFNRRVVERHLHPAPGATPGPAAASSMPEASRKLAGGETTGSRSKKKRTPAGVPESPGAPSGAPSADDPRSGGSRFAPPPANLLQPSGLPLSLVFAIPDHPWVDATAKDEKKAAVRIAMTVGVSGTHPGELRTVTQETPREDGSAEVAFHFANGCIAEDLTTGADVAGTVELKANEGLVSRGVQTIGEGFIVNRDQAEQLGLETVADADRHIREYRNGRDITDSPRGILCIDLFGVSADETRKKFPAIYQHLLTHVKPEREQSRRATYRERWWVLGEPQPMLRKMLDGLRRYIASPVTAKHRFFVFLDSSILPDQALNAIASDDSFVLGVLSSRIHVAFALAAGSRLGVGNDPRYNNTRCFDPFPFPDCDDATKSRIRALGEELDAHRKRVQAQHPGLSLTAMYNVLEALREGRPLTPKEQAIHEQGLVSVLHQLHDELDAAVAEAYGWGDLWQHRAAAHGGTLHDFETGCDLQLSATGEEFHAAIAEWEKELDAEILRRLVALNAERAAEEAAGKIRWLRPDYQNPAGTAQSAMQLTPKGTRDTKAKKKQASKKLPWPKPLAERVAATEQALRTAASPVTPAELARHFLRANPEDLAEILETLATLGRAHRDGGRFSGS